MKRMNRYLAILLAATLALPLAGCSNPDDSQTAGDSTGSSDSSAPESQTQTPGGATSLTVNGVPLSSYVIIYEAMTSSYKRQVSNFEGTKHGQENDFNKVTATRLQNALKERFGVAPELHPDTAKGYEHEILVGNTKREADDAFASTDNDHYSVAVSDGSLCFTGGAYGTTYHSVDYFLKYLDESSGEVNLASDFKLEGKHHLTVIGCIGDSITEGIGSSNAAMYAYPEAMNRILWKDCVVINYGVSGMTMRNDTGGWSYMSTGKYALAQRNASKVDVFTIMLGTNDSRGDIVNGYGKDQEKFEKGFSDLLAALHKRGKNARFILMNCPVYYGNETYGADYIVEWQSALYEKYKESYDLSFFDMRAFSKKNMPSSLFGDLLHPSDSGYVIMAEGVANMLKDYLGIS